MNIMADLFIVNAKPIGSHKANKTTDDVTYGNYST